MGKLLQAALRWTLRRFVWLLLIVAILAAGNALREEFREFETVVAELAQLRAGEKDIDLHLRRLEAATAERAHALAAAPLDALRARLASLDREIGQLETRHGGALDLLSGPLGKTFAQRLKRDVELGILEQERDHLQRLIEYAESLRDGQAARAKLEELRLAHSDAYARLGQTERQLAALDNENQWQGRLAFWSQAFAARHQLGRARAAQAAANLAAHDAYQRQRKLVERIALPGLPRFEIRRDQVERWLQPLRQAVREREESYRSNWVKRASGPVIDVLPAAVLILLSLIALPIAVKGALYFLVAPLAARCAPLRLMPQAAAAYGAPPGQTKISAVSLPLAIGRGQELLIHPEYLRSAATQGRIDTRWLLDGAYPLSSLAAGLFALTRIRCDTDASFVLGAARDPLSEIALLALPAGAALVFQPRALVGVVQEADRPLRITRHWRLGSLHGWLTLQLRYLVFHGPATLIVKGCRGIRVEAAGSGRSVNQAATLGFSADIDYATRRCETFGAYLMGKCELFNDHFSSDHGYYVYEEMPDRSRTAGIGGRGLEGIADSLLRVFGI